MPLPLDDFHQMLAWQVLHIQLPNLYMVRQYCQMIRKYVEVKFVLSTSKHLIINMQMEI